MCLCVCSRRARHPIETKADENHGEKTFLGCLEGLRCWEGSPLCDSIQGSDLGWGWGRMVKEGGDVCIHLADSLHCTAEISTTL